MSLYNTQTHSTFGDRTFAAAGPGLWNSLLPHLRYADLPYNRFRRSLKTFLFGQWDHGAVWTILTVPSRNNLTYLRKGKGLGTCCNAAYITWFRLFDQKCVTVSEVAADWHELVIPARIVQPSVTCTSEQLDLRWSMQIYHRLSQPL